VNQDEVESQLSAMFDGELRSSECELLSRRVDRDDRLRARWSRYALIGAAMRCEPVATAGSDFASRVSRAVDQAAAAQQGQGQGKARPVGRRLPARLLWQSALAAGLVGVVAGLSLVMLRTVALQSGSIVALQGAPDARLPVAAVHPAAVAAAKRPEVAHEPYTYTTPANGAADPAGLRTELVDYIVAHSEYSTPLVQPDLLSALISGEDTATNDDPQAHAPAVIDADAPAARSATGR
jgi:negative regulator of sigma E activity